MRRLTHASALIAIIAASATWVAFALGRQRPSRPVVGEFHRSKVDDSGHTRGIVQVDLMQQIIADKARLACVPAVASGQQVPTRDHPLLDNRAPPFVLKDSRGKDWAVGDAVLEGPVIVVFYLGTTCVACVTHLVELDAALPRFRERGARVWAVSGDAPEFSRERARKFGDFQIPLLSDADHSASVAYGVWKPAPGGDKDDGEAVHGTFIVDRDGLVRWAYVGDRPFTDIETLLCEISRSDMKATKSIGEP
jgi:peroxiredoxin